MIETDKIKDSADWIESKSTTNSGFITLGLLVAAGPLGFISWFLFQQTSEKDESLERKDAQIAILTEREAKLRDECAETIRTYFAMFKELGGQFSGNVEAAKSIERSTSATIDRQNEIIQNIQNDETED
jgi:hypothetical protein